jgi:stress-induced-phosphoprotein 1
LASPYSSSASHAGLKEWNKAVDDAKECIRLNPQFVKGYYRLATAQLELEEYDLAQATIKQGLAMDSNNAPLLKLLGNIKKARKVAMGGGGGTVGDSTKKLDAAASRELYDLQVQHQQTGREHNVVKANLSKTLREQKMSDATLSELEENPSVGNYYRSVGKIFVKSTREGVVDHLKTTKQDHQKKGTDLTQKIEYLERRMKSQQQNMRELYSQAG